MSSARDLFRPINPDSSMSGSQYFGSASEKPPISMGLTRLCFDCNNAGITIAEQVFLSFSPAAINAIQSLLDLLHKTKQARETLTANLYSLKSQVERYQKKEDFYKTQRDLLEREISKYKMASQNLQSRLEEHEQASKTRIKALEKEVQDLKKMQNQIQTQLKKKDTQIKNLKDSLLSQQVNGKQSGAGSSSQHHQSFEIRRALNPNNLFARDPANNPELQELAKQRFSKEYQSMEVDLKNLTDVSETIIGRVNHLVEKMVGIYNGMAPPQTEKFYFDALNPLTVRLHGKNQQVFTTYCKKLEDFQVFVKRSIDMQQQMQQKRFQELMQAAEKGRPATVSVGGQREGFSMDSACCIATAQKFKAILKQYDKTLALQNQKIRIMCNLQGFSLGHDSHSALQQLYGSLSSDHQQQRKLPSARLAQVKEALDAVQGIWAEQDIAKDQRIRKLSEIELQQARIISMTKQENDKLEDTLSQYNAIRKKINEKVGNLGSGQSGNSQPGTAATTIVERFEGEQGPARMETEDNLYDV